jgi:hypothetical protein
VHGEAKLLSSEFPPFCGADVLLGAFWDKSIREIEIGGGDPRELRPPRGTVCESETPLSLMSASPIGPSTGRPAIPLATSRPSRPGPRVRPVLTRDEPNRRSICCTCGDPLVTLIRQLPSPMVGRSARRFDLQRAESAKLYILRLAVQRRTTLERPCPCSPPPTLARRQFWAVRSGRPVCAPSAGRLCSAYGQIRCLKHMSKATSIARTGQRAGGCSP